MDKAAEKILATAAKRIYKNHEEAPLKADTAAAEKFLKLDSLKAATNASDPLGLVEVQAQQRRIDTNHKAIVSIRDFLNQRGTLEGKRLLEHFADPPYGWSNDTTRYILAAMLVGGELSMNVSGSTVTAPGQKAIEALKTNKSFANVGVSLRSDRPSNEMLATASKRLTELTGDNVLPLEQDITKAAVTFFKKAQGDLGSLSEKLAGLGVGGAARAQSLVGQLTDALLTDASDAPQRLGGTESSLYDDLRWARGARKALDQGLSAQIGQLMDHCSFIGALPSAGVPGALKEELAETRSQVEERLAADDFYHHVADLGTALTTMRSKVATATAALTAQQRQRIEDAAADLARLSEWGELTQEEQTNVVADLEMASLVASADLAGLKALLNHEYAINEAINQAKKAVVVAGEAVRQKRREKQVEAVKDAQRGPRAVRIPAVIKDLSDLDRLIADLQQLRNQMPLYTQLELKITQD